MNSFLIFLLKILVFIKEASQVAILKVEHCSFFAFGSLLVPSQNHVVLISNIYFFFEKLEKN